MTNAQLKRRLKSLGACSEAIEWLGKRDLATAWKECERPDWMLWLAGRIVDRKLLVKAACKCAELALPIFEAEYPKDTRVRNCIAVTLMWVAGKATLDEVRVARRGAAAAAAAYAAHAADAAYAAANAAADAAYAADAAAYAACAAARLKMQKKCCSVIRRTITYKKLQEAMQ